MELSSYEDLRHTLVIDRNIMFGTGFVDFDDAGVSLGKDWYASGPNYMLEAARGTSLFGPFISLGFVKATPEGDAVTLTLTLYRCYIDEDDSRGRQVSFR